MDKVIAYYGISWDLAIEILAIEHSLDDWIIYRFSTEPKKRRAKIRYDGDYPYFNTVLGKIQLNECLANRSW